MADQQPNSWHILLVDDDEEEYMLTRSLLAQLNGRKVRLEWASTYQQGRALLQSNRYDAVLVDYDLGPRSGLEFIYETVNQDYPAPLIMYTGRGNFDVDVEAMRAGATMYLTKKEATPLLMERFLRYAIERKRSLDEISRHQQERAELLGSIQDGFFSLDRSWCFRYVNRVTASAGNLRPEDFIGKNIWEMYPKLTGTVYEKNYRFVMSERRPVHFEVESVYNPTWHSISAYPSLDGISIFWQDISARKKLEEEIHNQALFPEENPNPVMRFSVEGGWLYANQAAKDIFPGTPAGKQALLPDELVMAAQAAINTNSAQGIELDCNGRTFLFNLIPIKFRGYVNLYGTDITSRKRAEAQQQVWARLIELSREPTMIWEPEQGIQHWNDGCELLYGYSRAEALGCVSHDLLQTQHPLAAQELYQYLLIHGQWNGELRQQTKDGREVIVDGRYELMEVNGRRLVLETNHDITERKGMEDALRESEQRFRAMADGTPMIIWVTDADGKLEFINRAYREFFGVASEQALSGQWQVLVHPDDKAGYVDVYIDCLQRQCAFHAIGRVQRHDGEWRWVESFGQPRYSASGAFLGLAGSSIEITDQKPAENTRQ